MSEVGREVEVEDIVVILWWYRCFDAMGGKAGELMGRRWVGDRVKIALYRAYLLTSPLSALYYIFLCSLFHGAIQIAVCPCCSALACICRLQL